MKRILVLAILLVVAIPLIVTGQNTIKTSNLQLTQIAGKNLFALKKCNACHTLSDNAEGKLTPVLNQRDSTWFKEHIKKESKIVIDEAASARKQEKVLAKETAALDDFLFKSKKDKIEIMNLPENVALGAYYAYRNNCTGCHTIAGQGKEIAPVLTFVADKRTDKAWHISHLENPQQFAPESLMPAFADKLSKEILGQIADYILTLKK